MTLRSPAEELAWQKAAVARVRLEEELRVQLNAYAIGYIPQHEFWKGRRWRFDFAFPGQKLAVEVQGAIWIGGRHSRGKGITAECEKIAHAAIAGWRVMPVTGDQIKSGAAIDWIRLALAV